jgi:hypothetical protein
VKRREGRSPLTAMAEFNPSLTESTDETLTDPSSGVKRIVYERQNGRRPGARWIRAL